MAIRLTNYIHPECFVADLTEGTREDALRKIVRLAAEKRLLKNEEAVYTRLIEREAIQSTAVGNGIAIPHCFVEEIPDLIIILARSRQGLEFGSFDGKPVHLVFLLMGNRQEHSLHLKALARIAMLIKHNGFIKKILASTSAQEMAQAFDDEESNTR